MSKYQTISVEEVIARTKMQLRLTDTSQDDFLDVLINEGLRHLDTLSLLVKKNKCICVSNGKAKLPSGFSQLLALRNKVTAYDGREVNATPVYIDKSFLRRCDVDENIVDAFETFDNTFQINDGYIYFGSRSTIEEVEIAYLGFNVDDYDRIMIYEIYERALTAYACYKFSMAYMGNFNQYAIEKYQREWVAQKNWLRGKDAKEDFQNTKFQINKIFGALVANSELMNYNSDLW